MFILAQTATNSSAAVGGSILGTVVWLAITVFLLVALWKVFVKAGQPGWASLIPIYNYVVMLHMTGKSGWWTLGLFVPFLNLFVAIRLLFNLATVFGRGVGFGFGLLLLSPIFVPILAFGDSRYVGPNGGQAGRLPTSGLAPVTG